MIMNRHRILQKCVALLLIWTIGLPSLVSAQASLSATPAATAAAAPGKGVTYKVCQPGVCFVTKADKDKYAKDNNCQFLEDVCERAPAAQDNKGVSAGSQGLFGDMWDYVKDSKLVYGAQFIEGLLSGMAEQITDLYDMVTNIGDVAKSLIDLGKAFYDDPEGTLVLLGEILGQEVIDTITKATQCGAYDLGKVIGSYVSPVVAVKLASKLAKFGGKMPDAIKDMKAEFGCASFGAGTLVMTADGLRPIESITVGQMVYSRNELSFADKAQAVTDLLGREAPSYRLLRTEHDSFKVTDEHPVWVQGKGWTVAAHVAVDDVIASEQGDTQVIDNVAVNQPLRVYNFTVANTENYFVGSGGLWAHNAKACEIDLQKKWEEKTRMEKGFSAELQVMKELRDSGFEPIGGTKDLRDKPTNDAYSGWRGQTGIDGIYVDKDGNYLIVESKATGGTKMGDPEDCVGSLCMTKDGRQMSDQWINNRLEKAVPDKAERDKLMVAMSQNKVKRIYAQTDKDGTIYNEILGVAGDDKAVIIGKEWKPPKK